ncbi:hypothetical protein M422DRAFT_268485 [Sphaerobolus stellatus SS14]|uniref:F-box domain-containing protein n=1 Tax=Sphaerobolus stellatus (strain SS14) TaxID=990650 RepID=A0A0C9U6W2_SPHS4|nr:hypothetical protein M422DRAFT_268485 [Sphaerobolus stellatus SS14]
MFICKEQYSTSLLPSLPPELVESIAADIDSPVDLLNLALTCRILHDIIIPFHLHFRKLNLNISGAPLALWYGIISSLVSFPSLQSLTVDFNHIDDDDVVLCFEIVSVGHVPKLKALRLRKIYINPNKPGPSVTTVLMSSATLPQLREFTLTVHSNVYFRDVTNETRADMGYGFLARHPQLESLTVLSYAGDSGGISPLNVIIVQILAFYALAHSLWLPTRSPPSLASSRNSQECVLHVSDYLSISFIRSLPISIQRLVVKTHPGSHHADSLEYTEYLTNFHNLTHVGGFNWTQSSIKDHFLDLCPPKAGIPLQKLKEGFAPEKEHLTHSQVFPWEISWDASS